MTILRHKVSKKHFVEINRELRTFKAKRLGNLETFRNF